MSVLVRGDFLKEAREFFEEFPMITENAAMLALNQVAERKAVPMIRHDAESQVNFPAGYLDNQDRLGLSQKATRGSLEAVITARDRPTSLARFAPGQTPENTRGQGITVQVKKGRSRYMKKAFMVRLNNGNIGLAIRLRQGERPDRAYKPVLLANNVYLLYGPSVDQVVRTVAEASLPAIGDMLSNEFFRQFARLSHG